MIEPPNYDHFPMKTDSRSAGWAVRIASGVVGGPCDLDLLERMIQAIRNEAAREVYAELATDLSADLLGRAFAPTIWGGPNE